MSNLSTTKKKFTHNQSNKRVTTSSRCLITKKRSTSQLTRTLLTQNSQQLLSIATLTMKWKKNKKWFLTSMKMIRQVPKKDWHLRAQRNLRKEFSGDLTALILVIAHHILTAIHATVDDLTRWARVHGSHIHTTTTTLTTPTVVSKTITPQVSTKVTTPSTTTVIVATRSSSISTTRTTTTAITALTATIKTVDSAHLATPTTATTAKAPIIITTITLAVHALNTITTTMCT